MKFNLNQSVRVRLTEHGRSILRQQGEALRKRHPKLGPYREPAVDADGYTRFQLWSLMEHFGEHIGLCHPNPFDLDIILDLTS